MRGIPSLWVASGARKDQVKAEPVFTLWDRRTGAPVYGGWASIIQLRSMELLEQRVQTSAQTGPRAWHALNKHFPVPDEWCKTRLPARTSEQARCRSAAQTDTVWGPGTRDRWEAEQALRRTGDLLNLERSCTACGDQFRGAWMEHAAWHCSAAKAAWKHPDAVCAKDMGGPITMGPVGSHPGFGQREPLVDTSGGGRQVGRLQPLHTTNSHSTGQAP